MNRRAPLKRSRPKSRPSLAVFWAAVTDNGTARCALAGLGGCYGKLDAHHYVPGTRLRHRLPKAEAERAVQDERCGVALCRAHHQAVEWRRVECPRPTELDGFLADYGLIERSAA